MIRINALYLLLLIEFLILMIAISLYLYYRNRKYRSSEKLIVRGRDDFGVFLEKQTAEKLEDMKNLLSGDEFEDNIETRIVREMHSLRLQFLKSALDGFRKGDTGYRVFWENLFKGFEDIIKDQLQKKRDLLLKEDTLKTNLNEIRLLKEERKKLQNVIEKQASKITELMSYKDMFNETQKRLNVVQQSNKDLRSKITSLMDKADEVEGIEDALTVFEKTNRELEMCVGILEKENERLSGDFHVWEEERKRIEAEKEHAKKVDEEEYNRIVQERDEFLTRLKGLEEKLEEKNKALSDLQGRYSILEQEYLVLYKQL